MKNITKEEYDNIFKKDENGAYINLIIPANEPYIAEENKDELNLIGKLPEEYSLDEIVRMKKYADKLFELIKEEK
ncbi:MAG: hypothetical protein J6O62_03580 [Bacilli bacterium]|nr:hypothetical protein [Bacilli bacterium]MBO6194922.1 hypothetical protein [Bacilli bacterium]